MKESSNNKKIAHNTLILFSRLIISTILGLFISRYLLLGLGVTNFGLYSVVGGIVAMMNIFNNSLTSSSFRYIAYEAPNGCKAVNKVFNISLALHIGLMILLYITTETIGVYYIRNHLNIEVDRIPDAIYVLRLSTLGALFTVLSIPFKGLLTAFEKFSVLSIIEIFATVLRLAIVIILLQFTGNRLRLFSLMTAFVLAFVAILHVLYANYKFRLYVKWNFQRDVAKFIEIAKFTGWVMVGALANMSKIQGSTLILNLFFGTVLNAAFSIANRINKLVLMFSQNISQAAIPQITKSYSIGNSDRTIQLVFHITKYSFFLMLLPAIPILLNTDYLLSLWLTEVPPYTSDFIRLMILNALIQSLSSGAPAAIQATGRIKHIQILLGIVSLISLPVSYYLFQIGLPPYTILIIYSFVNLIGVVIQLVFLDRLINFSFKSVINQIYLKIAFVSISTIPLFIISNKMPSSVLYFFVMSILATIWVITSVYFFGLDDNEKLILRDKAKSLLDKFSK